MVAMGEAIFQCCFFKADFFKTVIPRMCTLKVSYLGPGVRYTAHVVVILKLCISSIFLCNKMVLSNCQEEPGFGMWHHILWLS